MDYLKNLYEQTKELFIGMTPGSRIIAGLLAAILLVSFGFLIIGKTVPKEKNVWLLDKRHFTQSEQKLAEAAFSQAGLNDFEWQAGSLKVPKEKRQNYMAALAESNALPTDFGYFYDEMLANTSVYESNARLELGEKIADQKELSGVISKFNGIDTATVKINKKEVTEGITKKEVVTAAVSVMPFGNETLSKATVASISNYVAKATGISNPEEHISITNMKTNHTYAGTQEGLAGGGRQTYAEAEKEMVEEWTQKIRNHFPDIHGLIVTPSVELEEYSSKHEYAVKHDPKTTPVTIQEESMKSKHEGADRAGRPGMVAQMGVPQPNPPNEILEGDRSEEQMSKLTQGNALQGSEQEIEWAPFVPKKVTISIRIPKSYVRQAWMEENAIAGEDPGEPKETDLRDHEIKVINDIQTQVANLVYKDDALIDMKELIQVDVYPDPPVREVPELTFSEKMYQWLSEHWQSIGIMAIMLTGLFVLWNATRPKKPDPIVIYEAAEDMEQDEEEEVDEMDEEEQAAYQRELNSFDSNMRSLQEEVAELVDENPDAAVAVLKQWIGNTTTKDH